MSIESELRRLAQEAATRVQNRAARLHREYLEVQDISRNSKTNLERDILPVTPVRKRRYSALSWCAFLSIPRNL